MNILFEYDGILPVKRYGGTERIIFWLMKELSALGHQVTVIANGQSQVEEIGVNLIPREGRDWRELIPKDTDIIHLTYAPSYKLEYPIITTIHGNGRIGEYFSKNTVFVSKKHAENHGSDQYVYNGLDLSEYPFVKRESGKWNNFLFLAKASWRVKNLKDCIRVCKQSKKYLHIAGGRSFSFSKYIRSYGSVSQPEKLEILNKVDALLFPVRWHEPFGIAIIEALAMGIPVIGSTYGSLTNLLSDEVGYLCESYDDLLKVVQKEINSFDSEKLRAYVENNFTSKIMAQKYLALYQKVIDGENLNQEMPTYKSDIPPETLLPF